jgi:hypothetical protein
MRVYEELFILKPDAPEEEADAFIGQHHRESRQVGHPQAGLSRAEI